MIKGKMRNCLVHIAVLATAIAVGQACKETRENEKGRVKSPCNIGDSCDANGIESPKGGTGGINGGDDTPLIINREAEGGSTSEGKKEKSPSVEGTGTGNSENQGEVAGEDSEGNGGKGGDNLGESGEGAGAQESGTDATVDAGESDSPGGDGGPIDSGQLEGETEPCIGGRVDGNQAKELVEQGALLLDVRTAIEFEVGALPGAINIPVTDIPDRIDELPREKVIITYCRSGTRATTAAELLVSEGYMVCNLGPMSAW